MFPRPPENEEEIAIGRTGRSGRLNWDRRGEGNRQCRPWLPVDEKEKQEKKHGGERETRNHAGGRRGKRGDFSLRGAQRGEGKIGELAVCIVEPRISEKRGRSKAKEEKTKVGGWRSATSGQGSVKEKELG